MNYTSVPLPKVLADQIKAIGAAKGYRSVTEFVVEATRIHLNEIKKESRIP